MKTDVQALEGTDRLMVLLVDDQLIVGEAVRRMLAEESGIDFHYCAEPSAAVAMRHKSGRPSSSKTSSCPAPAG
jgi:PleD family two-component response regulator